jgi:hypothetical protein
VSNPATWGISGKSAGKKSDKFKIQACLAKAQGRRLELEIDESTTRLLDNPQVLRSSTMPDNFRIFQQTPLVNIGVANATFNTRNVDTTLNANLSFLVRPDLTNGPSVTLEAQLNAAFLLQETFESPDARVWQHNFDANLLQENNELTLIKAGGLGEISLSDFIIHYKTV